MMRATSTRTLAVLVGASLMLIAFNLRPLFSSLSVLLPEISLDLGMSGAMAGYLTTVPVLCMGLFAPFAPRLAQRIGAERSLLVVLVLIALGTGLRGYAGVGALFLGSALAGGAIAIGNVLLPSLVKRDFASHAALMTGLYTMSLCGGAAVAAAVTVPLIDSFDGGWAMGVAMWGIPAVVVAALWVPFSMRSDLAHTRRILPVRGLRHDPLAWHVTFFMGLQSALNYCVMGWLAPILRERGVDSTEAGLIVSVSILLQVAACLLTPMVATRGKDQRWLSVILTAIASVALIGLLFGPLWSIWVWAVVQGIGQGGLFAVAMMFIVLRSADSNVAAHLSSMAQTTGYVLAAAGPLLVGVLHDWTGNFAATGWVFAGLGILASYNGWHAGRNEHVKAEVMNAA